MIEKHPIESRGMWLAMRLRNVNASEVPIVCGEGAYGSLAELYAEKKGLRPPKLDTGVLRRGRWDEAAVFEALAEERPDWEMRRAKIYYCDPNLRIGATPDGFALAPGREGPGIVQAKSVGRGVFRKRWLLDQDGDIVTGEASPPPYYVLQVLTERLLTGCTWGGLAVIIRSGEWDAQFRWFDIERDETTEARILENVATFWRDYFDPGIMPPFDPQKDEALIRALYPQDAGTRIDLSTDNRALVLVDELIEDQAAIKRLTANEKAIKTELTGKLREHTYGLLADGRCLSFKTHHRKGYTVAPSDYRAMRILKQQPETDDDDD